MLTSNKGHTSCSLPIGVVIYQINIHIIIFSSDYELGPKKIIATRSLFCVCSLWRNNLLSCLPHLLVLLKHSVFHFDIQGYDKGYFRSAEVYFAMRDYAVAEKSYEKALSLSPDDQTIKRRLSLTGEALDGFYFRQLFPGRDFCLTPSDIIERQIFSSAKQMQNFVYLIGDAKTREAVVVDAAWDVKLRAIPLLPAYAFGIRAFAAQDCMKLVGAVVTHYHFDHTGGTPPPPFDALGIKVPGVRELAVEDNVPVYVNKFDAETIKKSNDVPSRAIAELEDSAIISVGSIKLHFIHTPGHTPGSQCILIPSVTTQNLAQNKLSVGGEVSQISEVEQEVPPDVSQLGQEDLVPIQEQSGGSLDQALLQSGDSMDQSLVEETLAPEMFGD
ncbi:hypothetical protein L7F22_066434 [Adiantum nelumboides]|nr:hypothetical protein [Adiantum nelumboides]